MAHRDLKPSNILLRRVGNDFKCVIGDFGFAVLNHKKSEVDNNDDQNKTVIDIETPNTNRLDQASELTSHIAGTLR